MLGNGTGFNAGRVARLWNVREGCCLGGCVKGVVSAAV